MNVYGIGRLTKDPELRYAASGTAFCAITLAYDTGFGENKKASFINFTSAGKSAESLAKYFAKGDQIFIKSGELQQRSWEDKEGKKQYKIEVFIKEWAFAGSKKNDNGEQPHTSSNPLDTVDGDDLPF